VCGGGGGGDMEEIQHLTAKRTSSVVELSSEAPPMGAAPLLVLSLNVLRSTILVTPRIQMPVNVDIDLQEIERLVLVQ